MCLYLGWTSLMHAADKGNTDVVKLLLENKADVNAMDNYGELQLWYICFNLFNSCNT